MLKKITHAVLAASLMLLVTAAAMPSPQEKTEKRPKDQQEYELINKAFSTQPSGRVTWNPRSVEDEVCGNGV